MREMGGRLGRQHIFVTDGQKRDYLSRASQRARGTTKNSPVTHNCVIVLSAAQLCKKGKVFRYSLPRAGPRTDPWCTGRQPTGD